MDSPHTIISFKGEKLSIEEPQFSRHASKKRSMVIICEMAVKCILPSIRAMLAKELMVKHGLNQAQAAKFLGMSQPAISLYSRRLRGKAINVEKETEITILIENLADELVEGSLSTEDFIARFCEICRTIRAKGLLCQAHKNFDPTIDSAKCALCKTDAPRCV